MPQPTATVQQQLNKIVIDQDVYKDDVDYADDPVFRIGAGYEQCVIDASSFKDENIDTINIAAYNPNLRVIVSGTFGGHIKKVAFSPQIYSQIGEKEQYFKCRELKKEVCCHIFDFINSKGGYYRDFATYDKDLKELTFRSGVLKGAGLSLLGMHDLREYGDETYNLYEYACNQTKVNGKTAEDGYKSVINKVVLPNDAGRFETDSFEDVCDEAYDPIEISELVLPAGQKGTFSLAFPEDCWDKYHSDWFYPTKDLHIENIEALRDVDLARLFGRYIDRKWANDIMLEIKNRDNYAMVDAFMQLMKDGSPAPKGLMYMIMNTQKGQENFVQLIDRFMNCQVGYADSHLFSGDQSEFWGNVSGELNRQLYNLNVLAKWLTELEQNQTQNKKLCLFDVTNVRRYIKHRIREKVTQIFVEHEFANNDLALTDKAKQFVNADVLTESADVFFGREIQSVRFEEGSLFGRFIKIFHQFGANDRREDINTMIRIIDVLNNAFNDVDLPKENNAVLVFRNTLIREIKKLMLQEIDYELATTNVHKGLANIKIAKELIDELCFFSIENKNKKRAIGVAKLWNVIQSFAEDNKNNGTQSFVEDNESNVMQSFVEDNENYGIQSFVGHNENNGRYLNSIQQQPNVNGKVRSFVKYVEGIKNKIFKNYGEDEIQALITM